MATATDRSVHILRRNPEIFAWPLSNALHHARMSNQGMSPQQAEKVENFVRNMAPDDMPRLEALLDQFRLDYSRQYAPELISVIEEIADGRRRMPALQDYPDSIGKNQEMLNTPLYAWTVEDILQTAEEADEDPSGTARPTAPTPSGLTIPGLPRRIFIPTRFSPIRTGCKADNPDTSPRD